MCIPAYMCADGTASHLCISLVGVEVRLGTTADEKYISHMASSKTQKRTNEDDSSDDEKPQTNRQKSYAQAAIVNKPKYSSIQTQTDITWLINATDLTLLPTPEKNITPTTSHATMSTQTVNEPSQQPTNIIEPTTAKAKIPPNPSQNTKSYTRKPITAPQGGSQEPRRNSLGSRPSKGSSDPQREII